MSQIPTTPYRRLYPDDNYVVLDGGVDNKFPRALIPDNESPDALNVEFIDGVAGTRQGATKLNTQAAGSYAFDGLYTRRDNQGNETMLAFIGGHMMALSNTTFVTIPSAQSVFTIGARVGADFGENYMFACNGVNGPYKWDGTYFTQHGISAPVAAVTPNATATAGSLGTSGIYFYKITMVNSALVESDVGPVSASFVASGSGGACYITSIQVGTAPSQGVLYRRLYRTLASGTSISAFFRVATITNNTATTYLDQTADVNLTTAAPTDQGVPPKYNVAFYDKTSGRLFVNDVAHPNYFWYSAPLGSTQGPYSYPSTNFRRAGDNSSDLVKGFATFDNGVIILCELSSYILYMSDPATDSTWELIKTQSPYGSKSPYCALLCDTKQDNIVLHPAVQNKKFAGFAALRGAALAPSVTFEAMTTIGSFLQSNVIEPDMFQINESYLGNITGIVFKNRAFISVTFGSSHTTNNRVYVWDFSLGNLNKNQLASWVPWTGTPYNIAQFTIYNSKLYAGTSDATGFVYQVADTNVYSDDGSAIDSYIWTKEFPGFPDDIPWDKDFRYINMLIDNAGSYYMNLRYRTDSNTGIGSVTQVYLGVGTSKWGHGPGQLVWGTGQWGEAASTSEPRVFLGSSIRGKRIQFRFDNQNTIGQRFKIHRLQFSYNVRGLR